MKTQMFSSILRWVCVCGVSSAWLHAQGGPEFTRVQRLGNLEMALTLTNPPGVDVRFDGSTDLSAWSGLVALRAGAAATSLQYTDSAAPFMTSRYYRAEQLAGTNRITGDILPTSAGDVIIHPLNHATFVMNWQETMIYVDPVGGISYAGMPKADLILVTHGHSDHFSASTIDSVRKTNAIIVAPQGVYSSLSAAQKALTCVLGYGQSTNLLSLGVEAVAAYNSNHPYGTGNGYLVTIGGRRIYIAGDTSDTPEMRQLKDIEIAFIPMNQPYTFTVAGATNAVAAFRPRVVYPYHYRDSSGTTTSAAQFKQQLRPDLGIEVRLRKWY